MKLKQLDVYFIQETWLEGDVFDEVINGYHIFRHNGELGNHNFPGVAIILSPKYHEGWKAAGARPPITTDATGEFTGRFISMNIKLASKNCGGKQVRGIQGNKQLTLTLASVYHPCTKTGDDAMYLRFLDTLDTLLGLAPTKSEIIMGADINSNIGTLNDLHSTKFCAVLGPHGLSKRNKKGKNLLHVYLAHQLRVMNTFSKEAHRARGTAPGPAIGIADTHMLDVIVCSAAQAHSQLPHDPRWNRQRSSCGYYGP